ncbi:MAG: diguanylate cyclase [Butyrivibrio sp.]|nr:diguanylate cyclase [Butyrivibrio sp.]
MKRLSRTTKYMIFICTALVLFNLAFGFMLTRASGEAMREQINARMLDISNTAASMLDGDDLAKITVEDLGSPEYQRVFTTLSYFQNNMQLAYIYCIMQMDEKEFVFCVDPTIEDPGEFGSPIVYTDALYNASKGKAGVDQVPYEDGWGEFYSSYSPVFDSKGNVAGIVAADFDAEWYQEQIKHLVRITGGFSVLAILVSIVLTVIIASHFRKNFMNLFGKMNELSLGIETLVHEVMPDAETDNYTSLSSIESRKGIRDEVELMGEKINVMQERLAGYIDVIRSNAYVDGLTGLNNRTSYGEYIQILDNKIRDKKDLTFSVVVFDINQLKIVNDNYGHEMGDKLIVDISKLIRKIFDGHRIYRIGGDEFVCILSESDPSARIQKLKGLIDIKNLESPVLHDPSVEIGVSIGGASYDPETDKVYTDVFNKADAAMYADKRLFYETHEDRRKKRR